MSTIGGLAITPGRRHVKLCIAVQRQNVRAPDLIRYLRALHQQHRGPSIVVLDRLNAHRSAVRRLQERGQVGCRSNGACDAPELNPVEAL